MNAMFHTYVLRNRPQIDMAARDMAGVFPAMSTEESLPNALSIGLVDSIMTRENILLRYGRK